MFEIYFFFLNEWTSNVGQGSASVFRFARDHLPQSTARTGRYLLKFIKLLNFSIVAILFKTKKENEIHSKLATNSIDVFFFFTFSLECRLCGLRAVGNNRKSGGRKRWIQANYVIDETL